MRRNILDIDRDSPSLTVSLPKGHESSDKVLFRITFILV